MHGRKVRKVRLGADGALIVPVDADPVALAVAYLSELHGLSRDFIRGALSVYVIPQDGTPYEPIRVNGSTT